jgi:hypothetical protein
MTQSLPDAAIHSSFNASLLPKHRRLIIQEAIGAGATHALCLDDDMMFPVDTAVRLASHGLPMVACNYQGKTGKPTAIDFDGVNIRSAGRTDLQEVSRVGFGVVFLDLGFLQKVPMPWFGVPWIPSRGIEMGEDFVFCLQWREQGFPIYVDHDLSNQIDHIADQYLRTL